MISLGSLTQVRTHTRHLCDETDLPPTMQPLILREINDQVNEFLRIEHARQVSRPIDPAAYG